MLYGHGQDEASEEHEVGAFEIVDANLIGGAKAKEGEQDHWHERRDWQGQGLRHPIGSLQRQKRKCINEKGPLNSVKAEINTIRRTT